MLDGRYLYLLLGLPNTSGGLAGIRCYDLADGALVEEYEGFVGEDAAGGYEFDFVEHEGMFIYKDPHTGDVGLFVDNNTGVSSGGTSKIYNLIAFAPKSIQDRFNGYVMRHTPKHTLRTRKGRAQRLLGFTNFNQFVQSGVYYLDSSNITALDDPTLNLFNLTSGAFLEVERVDTTVFIAKQKLYFNSTSTPVEMERIIRGDVTATPWTSNTQGGRIPPLKQGVDILTLPPGIYEGSRCLNIPIAGDVSLFEFDITIGGSSRKQIEAILNANGRKFIKTIHTNGSGGSTAGTSLAAGWKEFSYLS